METTNYCPEKQVFVFFLFIEGEQRLSQHQCFTPGAGEALVLESVSSEMGQMFPAAPQGTRV